MKKITTSAIVLAFLALGQMAFAGNPPVESANATNAIILSDVQTDIEAATMDDETDGVNNPQNRKGPKMNKSKKGGNNPGKGKGPRSKKK